MRLRFVFCPRWLHGSCPLTDCSIAPIDVQCQVDRLAFNSSFCFVVFLTSFFLFFVGFWSWPQAVRAPGNPSAMKF